MTPIQEKALCFLRKQSMDAESIDMVTNTDAFLKEMENGLQGHESSLAMIPTYIGEIRTLPADGAVIVLDAGGTHLRCAIVRIRSDGSMTVANQKERLMPGTEQGVSKSEFFSEIVDFIEPLLPSSDRIGFCFSFGTIPSPDKDARVFEVGKELKAPGLIGCHLAEEMQGALSRRGYLGKKITVLNDSVATLLGGMASTAPRPFDDYVGFILGTGTNTCYFEKIQNITKLKQAGLPNRMIVNMESGNYAGFRRGQVDMELDRTLVRPGTFQHEKMVSGRYQGSVLLLTLKKAAQDGLLHPTTGQMLEKLDSLSGYEIDEFLLNPYGTNKLARCCLSESSGEDQIMIYHLIDGLAERAARFLTVNLAAVLIKTGRGKNPCRPVCLSTEGSTFYNSRMIRRKLEYLTRYITDRLGIYFEFVKTENANLIGSALACFSS